MKSDKVSAGSVGVGFFALLTLLLIGLKLTGYIDWTWLWVLAPLWMSFTCFVAIFALGLLFLVVAELLKESKRI